MERYVALLRGINVGGARRLEMRALRDALAAEGLAEVRTLLQSGNVLFGAADRDAGDLAAHLEILIAERFSLQVPCVVCTASEISSAMAANPFPERVGDGAKLLLTFLAAAPTGAQRAAHDVSQLDPADIRLGDRVVYQWCPDGVHKAPPVVAFVERHWKIRATARNWSTLEKIAAALAG